MIAGIPVWVFVVILFIFFSGFMAFQAIRAEKKLEQQFIEREGNVYMERMRNEQRKRSKMKM